MWLEYVHPVGKGSGKNSEAVKPTQKFHPIEALEPGTDYTVRLVTKNWVDNNSIFEDVIETRGRGETWKPFQVIKISFECKSMSRFHLMLCSQSVLDSSLFFVLSFGSWLAQLYPTGAQTHLWFWADPVLCLVHNSPKQWHTFRIVPSYVIFKGVGGGKALGSNPISHVPIQRFACTMCSFNPVSVAKLLLHERLNNPLFSFPLWH